MKKWNMVIDLVSATTATMLVLADKDEFVGKRLPALLGRPAVAPATLG